MKENHQTTEALLQKGKGISLSSDERADMKATLLAYAKYHSPAMEVVNQRTAPKRFHWWQPLAGVAVLLIMVAGTGVASTSAVPGDTLYIVKVDVLEELNHLTKMSREAKLEYNVHRIETRLTELRQLSDQNELSSVNLSMLESQLSSHVANLSDVLKTSDGDIFQSDVVDATNDVVAAIRAVERLATGEVNHEGILFDNVADAVMQLHNEEVTELLFESTSAEITEYLAKQLEDIQFEVESQTMSASTTARVTEYLEDVSDAIANNELDEAALYINEAVQQLQTEAYLHNFEVAD